MQKIQDMSEEKLNKKSVLLALIDRLFNPSIQKRLLLIISVCVGLLVLFLNVLYPTVEDDWTYTFIWRSDGLLSQRITNFNTLFISQYNHYMEWGGRTVAHIIAQLLLTLSPIYQDVLNTLAYFALMLLMYKYAAINTRARASVFLLTCLLFWFLQPALVGSSIWITGSANYMWLMVIILSFIYPFYSLYINENGKNSILRSILFFIIAIIAGWTNENMVFAIFFLVVSLMVLLAMKQQHIPNWVYWSILGLIIGALLLLLAPGNMVRYGKTEQGALQQSIFSGDIIIPRLRTLFMHYLRYIIFPALITVVSIIHFHKKGNSYQKNKIVPLLSILFIAAHIAFFVMLASPEFPKRAMFGTIVLLIIAICIAYANNNFKCKKLHAQIVLFFTIAIICFGVNYVHTCKRLYQIYKTINNRDEIIEKGKKIGIQDFVFDDHLVLSSKYHYWDLLEDPKAGKNKAYSSFHNIRSVSVIDRSTDSINSQLIYLKAQQDSLINTTYHDNK